MITKFKYYSLISFVNYVPCPEAKESVIGSEVELSFQCRISRDEATIRGIYYNNYAITWLPFTTMYTYCKFYHFYVEVFARGWMLPALSD